MKRARIAWAGAVHATLPDAHCVMHVRTTPTMAVCCSEEGARILASAGGKRVLLLRNHGPVIIGHTLPQAFNLMWLVQRACEIQVASATLGKLRPIPVPVLEGCVRDSLNFNPRSRQPPDAAGAAAAPEGRWDAWGRPGASHGAGEDSFAAMQRLIDRNDPGYRA